MVDSNSSVDGSAVARRSDSRGVKGSLAALFEPRCVAVIGASRDPSKVGGSVLANLQAAGFDGRVVPVNAAAAMMQGLAAVPSVLASGWRDRSGRRRRPRRRGLARVEGLRGEGSGRGCRRHCRIP
jgi:hypothetical protein